MMRAEGNMGPHLVDSPLHAADSESCGLRSCGQCGNPVSDPLVTRCPRCWAALPKMDCGSCRGCPMS